MIKPNYSLNSLIFFNIFLLFLALISLDSIHACTMQTPSDTKASEDDYNAGKYSVGAVCSGEKAGDLKVNKNEDKTTSTDKYSNQKAEDTGIMEFKNVKVINRPQPSSGSSNPRGQGMVVTIDPETGEFTVPKPGQIPPPKPFPQASQFVSEIEIEGGVVLPLPPSAIAHSTVTIEKDGNLKFSCTNDQHEKLSSSVEVKNGKAIDYGYIFQGLNTTNDE